jgi:D-alanyl-lipoteichoic acid acyltransferase DltB (MBOAT superfamily)
VKAERHFGLYALYVMFYPQLVAGPIERPQNLLPQLHSKHDFNFEECKAGLMQMAFGFFKKVVIADRLAIVVDEVYGNVAMQNGSTMVIATVFYAFQIYCDFSGYSDIAIGAARIMGIKLMTNFNAPYFSKSIAEFWKRWHISLSTWFKDYLYISLGGNRVSIPRWYVNLLLVFLISGLWHGANWTFMVWGGLHGIYMVFGIWKNKVLKYFKIPELRGMPIKILNVSATFMLVCFAWIFFRATNFAHAVQIIKKIGSISLHDKLSFSLNGVEMWFCVVLIVLLSLKERYYLRIQTKNTAWFFILIVAIAFGSYLFGVFNNKQFIYFQF